MTGKKRQYTEEQAARVAELRATGMQFTKIALEVNLSASVCGEIMRRRVLDARKKEKHHVRKHG